MSESSGSESDSSISPRILHAELLKRLDIIDLQHHPELNCIYCPLCRMALQAQADGLRNHLRKTAAHTDIGSSAYKNVKWAKIVDLAQTLEWNLNPQPPDDTIAPVPPLRGFNIVDMYACLQCDYVSTAQARVVTHSKTTHLHAQVLISPPRRAQCIRPKTRPFRVIDNGEDDYSTLPPPISEFADATLAQYKLLDVKKVSDPLEANDEVVEPWIRETKWLRVLKGKDLEIVHYACRAKYLSAKDKKTYTEPIRSYVEHMQTWLNQETDPSTRLALQYLNSEDANEYVVHIANPT